MGSHPFKFVLDGEEANGHVFGVLSMRYREVDLPIARKCVLCGKVPMELITKFGALVECNGLERSR